MMKIESKIERRFGKSGCGWARLGLGALAVCDHMTVSLLEHVTRRIRVCLVIDARATPGLCFGVATVAQPSSADSRCRL